MNVSGSLQAPALDGYNCQIYCRFSNWVEEISSKIWVDQPPISFSVLEKNRKSCHLYPSSAGCLGNLQACLKTIYLRSPVRQRMHHTISLRNRNFVCFFYDRIFTFLTTKFWDCRFFSLTNIWSLRKFRSITNSNPELKNVAFCMYLDRQSVGCFGTDPYRQDRRTTSEFSTSNTEVWLFPNSFRKRLAYF